MNEKQIDDYIDSMEEKNMVFVEQELNYAEKMHKLENRLGCSLEVVEKSLKAFEIIKEKRVNAGTFIHLTKVLKKDYEQCKALNNTFGANICETEKEFLTEEEFNLLKEILGC